MIWAGLQYTIPQTREDMVPTEQKFTAAHLITSAMDAPIAGISLVERVFNEWEIRISH
jgi:hypothetical protein